MEITKINLNSKVKALNEFNVLEMKESGGELLITLANKECYEVYEGQKLMFKRFIYDDNNLNFQITSEVTVLSEDENHIIHTTLPLVERHMLYCDEDIIKQVSGETYNYFILKTVKDHNIFFQDLSVGGQEIYLKDYEGNLLATYNEIGVPLKRDDIAASSADCVTYLGEEETCGKSYKRLKQYQYSFLPEKISRNQLIVKGFTKKLIPEMAYFETKFNPFYWYYIEKDEDGNPTNLDSYGNPVKICQFYTDSLWSVLTQRNDTNLGVNYVNYGDTRSSLGIFNSYWDINIGLTNNANETTLGSEDNFGSSFIKDVEEALIPDIIDMERVKYSPMVYTENGELMGATSLTFNYHFRERKKLETDDDRLTNTMFTSGNVYFDNWYIDNESGEHIWWNGYKGSTEGFDKNDFEKFLSKSGETSDLLGYLNFTDNDVYYRKKKVSQSFIRLTFYNSTDPLEQKLLFYSTVFLDSTALYGKYIKQLMFMEDEGLIASATNKNVAVVMCSANTASRVDTKMIITNEYDRTKSSEGFNLYLFAEDANFNFDENGEKTIYMKVEFNHAGNGKTLPMIMWPKVNGEYVPLTMDNFIENLYIPIKLTYLNDRYVYYIPNAKNENGNISLVLFEPKLDEEKEKKNT